MSKMLCAFVLSPAMVAGLFLRVIQAAAVFFLGLEP